MSAAACATLGEVADLLVGNAFKSDGFLNEDEDGIPILRGENVGQGSLNWFGKTKRWREDDLPELARYELQLCDVILAMDRPIVGDGLKYAWITEADLPCLLVQRVCRIRGKADKAVTDYLRYVIASPAFTEHIHRITTGANIPHISGKDISAFSFLLPSLAEQEKIVEALAPYDELVKTCEKQIALLEEAARLIHTEWFVRLRFPVHGKDSSAWPARPLNTIADINAESLAKQPPWETLLYVDISSVSPGLVEQKIEYSLPDAPGRAKRLVAHGDIIWSCVRPNRRSHALILNPEENLVVSTGFATIRSRSVPWTYLYLALTTDAFVAYLESHAQGAAYPAVTGRDFEKAEILLPPPDVLEQFDQVTKPIFEQIETLKNQIEKLRQARDLLLPRLISGQLRL